jgi:hypothetical protein
LVYEFNTTFLLVHIGLIGQHLGLWSFTLIAPGSSRYWSQFGSNSGRAQRTFCQSPQLFLGFPIRLAGRFFSEKTIYKPPLLRCLHASQHSGMRPGVADSAYGAQASVGSGDALNGRERFRQADGGLAWSMSVSGGPRFALLKSLSGGAEVKPEWTACPPVDTRTCWPTPVSRRAHDD